MIIWFSLLIPFVSAAVMLILFKHKATWYELLIPFACAVICIFISKHISQSAQEADYEYHGSYAEKATYYESWNERVSCSHTKYCTRTNSDGRTEEYPCGTEHMYDVDDHPPRWVIDNNLGETFSTSQDHFEELARRWKNKKFEELNRDYHTVDGDSYITTWNSDDKTLEPLNVWKKYKNKVQNSSSIFNFQEVSEEDRITYGIFEYNPVINFKVSNLYGISDELTEHKLQLFNSKHGATKQVRLLILVFQNQPIESAILQENYWKGGNKNEFIICIGKNQDKIEWCHIISWTEIDILKIKIRDLMTYSSISNLASTIDLVTPLIMKEFVRKEFSSFDYLHTSPTTKCIIITYIVVLIITCIISYWIFVNDIEDIESLKSKDFIDKIRRMI